MSPQVFSVSYSSGWLTSSDPILREDLQHVLGWGMNERAGSEMMAPRPVEVVLKGGSESPEGAGLKCRAIAAESGGKFPR